MGPVEEIKNELWEHTANRYKRHYGGDFLREEYESLNSEIQNETENSIFIKKGKNGGEEWLVYNSVKREWVYVIYNVYFNTIGTVLPANEATLYVLGEMRNEP